MLRKHYYFRATTEGYWVISLKTSTPWLRSLKGSSAKKRNKEEAVTGVVENVCLSSLSGISWVRQRLA